MPASIPKARNFPLDILESTRFTSIVVLDKWALFATILVLRCSMSTEYVKLSRRIVIILYRRSNRSMAASHVRNRGKFASAWFVPGFMVYDTVIFLMPGIFKWHHIYIGSRRKRYCLRVGGIGDKETKTNG